MYFGSKAIAIFKRARKLGLLQYSLNRSVSTGSVKLSVFLRALGLMGYTLEIKKEGKTVVSIWPEDYSPAEREDHNQ